MGIRRIKKREAAEHGGAHGAKSFRFGVPRSGALLCGVMLLAGVVSLSIGNALADGVGDGPTGHADGTHSATDRAAGDDPQPISRAKMIAYSCFSCHDRTGQGIKSMPPISGFSPEQMVRMLEDFRDGHGEPTVMDRHAAGYSQEDFEAIAEFLSTMDWEGEVSDED